MIMTTRTMRTAAAALFVLTTTMALGQSLLDPARLTKYIDPLPIPAVVPVSETICGIPLYDIQATQIEQRLHAELDPTPLLGYNGTYPGPTFVVRSGQPVKVRFSNNMPSRHVLRIDTSLMGTRGVPECRMVTHLHGGVVLPQFDGWPYDWWAPGQSRIYDYPNCQPATTLWYHDHSMGITRLNAYAGLAGFYLIRDDFEDALNLPKGKYEIGIALQDKQLYDNGALYYPAKWVMQFFGNVPVVNGKIWPKLEVDPRKYRFHFLDGSGSRFYSLRLLECNAQGVVPGDSVCGPAFNQIGSDQGLLPAPVVLNDPANPASRRMLISPGERMDVVIDFAGKQGRYYLLQNNDKGAGCGGMGGRGGCMNSPLPEIMLVHVKDTTVLDSSSLPGLIRPVQRIPESEARLTRDIKLGMMHMMIMLNDMMFDYPITETPILGTTEIWRMINTTMGTHPMHLHLVQFQVLDRQPFNVMEYKRSGQVIFTGPREQPDPEEMGWKDVFRCPQGYVSRLITRFEPFSGRYEYHCHILEHEENEMMRPYEVLAGPGNGVASAGSQLALEPLRNCPEPFQGNTSIAFTLPYQQAVRLTVYNVAGREIVTLANGDLAAGEHRVTWNGNDASGTKVAAGVYYYKLQTPNGTETRRATLYR